jgi:hypothetical protein
MILRPTVFLRFVCIAVTGLAVLGGACKAGEDECVSPLDGTQWESAEAFPCPQSEDPTCTYRHDLSFDDGQFNWIPSDYNESGPYTYDCDSGELSAINFDDSTVFTAVYDEAANSLTLTTSWATLEYRPAS